MMSIGPVPRRPATYVIAAALVLLASACADAPTVPAPAASPGTVSRSMARAERAFHFTTVQIPGALATQAYDVGEAGQVVGSYRDATGTHGYLLAGGSVTQIQFPGSSHTEAWGINARGDIVGRYTKAGVPRIFGFLLRDGVYTDISVPGHLNTMPTGISASGEIVGCVHGDDFMTDMRGWVRRGSEVTLFEALPSTMHNGVAPGGNVVVGLYYETMDLVHAYIIDRGVYTQFDVPGANFTSAWDVNAAAQVVGTYGDASGIHGYLRTDAGFTSIDVPGAARTWAYGINARGVVAGTYVAGGKTYGYLATPTGSASE